MSEKKYKRRSTLFRTLGIGTIFTTTLGGFFAYQMAIDWQNFRNELDQFVVIEEDYTKLNLLIALPALMGLLVFLFIMLRKNRQFFNDKASLGLIVTIVIFYLVYSVIEVTLFSLIGAFVGTSIDEFIFSPIHKHYKKLAGEERDIDNEYRKEQRRIKARNQAQEDLNGSV
jgi:L-cystine uptake protein TcyP (sodium:dicarboxylate symporter family)